MLYLPVLALMLSLYLGLYLCLYQGCTCAHAVLYLHVPVPSLCPCPPSCHRRPRGPPIGNKHPNAHTWLTSGAGASEKMQEKCMHACAIGKLEAAAGLHQGLQCCTGCTACTCPVLAPGTWQAWVLYQACSPPSVHWPLIWPQGMGTMLARRRPAPVQLVCTSACSSAFQARGLFRCKLDRHTANFAYHTVW